MHRWASMGLVMCLGASVAAAAADFVEPREPGAGDLSVIGAVPVSPTKWPATFIFRTGAGACTSTAVGSDVILTAAHCVIDGGSGSVQVKAKKIALTCYHHPDYATRNSTYDFALCKLSESLSGMAFENISTSLAHARNGQQVTLLGYGCTKEGGVDRDYGVLHEGPATVVRKPTQESADTVTNGGAAVCFGDSGGAAYFDTTASGANRVIFGVNSRGDINEFSFISSTATVAFVDWAVNWSAQHNARICGIDPKVRGCRPL